MERPCVQGGTAVDVFHHTVLQEPKETKLHYVKEMFISLMNTYSTLFEHKKCNMHSNYSNVQYKILLHT